MHGEKFVKLNSNTIVFLLKPLWRIKGHVGLTKKPSKLDCYDFSCFCMSDFSATAAAPAVVVACILRARPVFRYDKAWNACAQHTTRGSICRTVTYSMLEIYFAFETLFLNNPTWSNGQDTWLSPRRPGFNSRRGSQNLFSSCKP